jgi:tetratricopeptide (TPR) repeat protein
MANNSHRDVFISSTTRDLEDHRQIARDAVWRANLFPLMMERDFATMEDPIEYSLNLVEDAEIYVGIFALRYGYVPDDPARNPDCLSITELEYRHAVKRGIPVLVFVMHDEHLVQAGHVENDPEKLTKLNQLKQELTARHVVGFFKSVEDLSNQVFQALQSHKIQHHISRLEGAEAEKGEPHRGGGIDLQPFYAHAYIQPHNFVGRRAELAALDEWAHSDDVVQLVRAMGGVGKSALTWEWVRQQAQARHPFTGIMWWSFYESHSALENFIPEALAYCTGKEPEAYAEMTRAEREQRLLTQLQSAPYLIVLDGIERIMVAYQRLDSSHLDDNEQIKERQLRGCADPRDDEFLARLVGCAPSKFLVSTRLIPQAFTNRQGDLVRGARRIDLEGLNTEDALALMTELGVSGTPESMTGFMEQFGNHSLLLSIIAGRITNYRPAPGYFDAWYADEGRDLRLSDLELGQRRTHVLQYALAGLSDDLRKLLGQISTFRYPVDYQTLSDVNPFVPDTTTNGQARSDLVNVRVKLHKGLTELEERGLVWWDRAKNRYDLHPIVRGYVYEQMAEHDRRLTFRQMHNYFANLPPEDLDKVEKLDDLKRSLELYEVLVRLNRWDDAMDVYDKNLKYALTYKLAHYDTIVELLSPLFPDGLDELPRLSSYRGQNICLTDLATAFSYLGQTDKAMLLRGLKIKLALKQKSYSSMGVGLRTYSSSLRLDQNKLATSLKACKLALEVAEASGDLDNAGISYMYLLSLYRDMGWWLEAKDAYDKFNDLLATRSALRKWQPTSDRFYAEMLIFQQRDATELLNKIWRQAQNSKNKNQVHIRELYRLRGESALLQEQYGTAAGFFLDTLTLGRRSNIPVAGVLARLAYVRVCEGLHEEALELLDEALETEGGERLHDLFNSAAEIYLTLGDADQAAHYATLAYQAAWTDGLPFVWWWRLERARQVLAQLDVPEPEMPPFSEENIEKVPYESEIYAFIDDLRGKS